MLSLKDFEQKQIVFVFLDEGEALTFRNDNIVVRDADNNIKHQSTCYLLFAVFLCGHITVTSGLLERAAKFGFTVVLMNHSLRCYAVIPARAEGNVILRRKQYNYSGWSIGAHIIANKILNQQAVLRHIRDKDEALRRAIDLLTGYAGGVLHPDLKLDEIMGIEGTAAKVYFSQMFREHSWTARRPRVKHDMTNCLLDIGYTLLFNIVNALLELYGFDTYVGVLHREFYQRKSLTCDLVEPFRPLIDARIRKMLNLGQCRSDDFQINQGQYSLFGKKSVPYLRQLLEAVLERKSEMFLFFQGYYRAFMRDKLVADYPSFRFCDTGGENADRKL